jgi:predicted YcjX-like family ATPase
MALGLGTLVQVGIRHAVAAAPALMDSALNEHRIRPAVTRLSGAGKTAGASGATGGGRRWASVRSTTDVTLQRDGRLVRGVPGVRGGGPARPFSLGQSPSSDIPDYFLVAPYFDQPDFRPAGIRANGDTGIPHRALDEVLDTVIGDPP